MIPSLKILEEIGDCFFKEVLLLENVRFKRCVKPQNAVGSPELNLFSDGSNRWCL